LAIKNREAKLIKLDDKITNVRAVADSPAHRIGRLRDGYLGHQANGRINAASLIKRIARQS
jgi:hypothetical protein